MRGGTEKYRTKIQSCQVRTVTEGQWASGSACLQLRDFEAMMRGTVVITFDMKYVRVASGTITVPIGSCAIHLTIR